MTTRFEAGLCSFFHRSLLYFALLFSSLSFYCSLWRALSALLLCIPFPGWLAFFLLHFHFHAFRGRAAMTFLTYRDFFFLFLPFCHPFHLLGAPVFHARLFCFIAPLDLGGTIGVDHCGWRRCALAAASALIAAWCRAILQGFWAGLLSGSNSPARSLCNLYLLRYRRTSSDAGVELCWRHFSCGTSSTGAVGGPPCSPWPPNLCLPLM